MRARRPESGRARRVLLGWLEGLEGFERFDGVERLDGVGRLVEVGRLDKVERPEGVDRFERRFENLPMNGEKRCCLSSFYRIDSAWLRSAVHCWSGPTMLKLERNR